MRKTYSFIRKYKFLLLLLLLPLTFFSKIIFNPDLMFFPSQDIVSIFFQEKELFRDTINTYKTLPLWNPYIFSGSPFLGNPTSSMFYPLNLLFLFLPVDSTFGYMFVFNSLLIGLFTYLFAKSIRLDNFSSFISAITIMLSGPMLTLIFPGHLVNFDTFIWFPLILLLYELALKKQNIIYGALASIPIALMLLAGASQIAVFSLLSSSIYYLLRITMNIPRVNKLRYFRKTIAFIILSITVGLLLAAIQIIPTNEFSRLSARVGGISYEFASDFSLHPKQLISFVFPYFFGNPADGTYWGKGNFWELNGYVGVLPLFLAFIAIIYRKSQHTTILTMLGIFALLFSLGKFSFVSPFFYNHIPPFDSFRVPARFLYVYAFSISILAGIGINTLIENFDKKKYFFNITSKISILVGVGILITVYLLNNQESKISLYEKFILSNSYAVGLDHSSLLMQFVNGLLFLGIMLILFGVLIFFKSKNKISINILKVALATIIILDLFIFNFMIISFKKIKEVYQSPEFIKEIKKDNSKFRIFDKEGLYLPISTRNKIENITGIHSLYIKDYRDFIWSIGEHENKPYESFFGITEINYPIFLDLLNVKYVISNKEIQIEAFDKTSEYDNIKLNYLPKLEKKLHLYENKNYLPRAYIVSNAIVLSKKNTLNKLKDADFNPKRQVIFQKNPNVNLNNPTFFKEVEIKHQKPNKIKLEVTLENPGFLVLSEIYYPGWRAYDNKKETEIYKADYILRSIYLDKGSHDITFVYFPDSYKIGATISLSTLFLLLLYLLLNKGALVDTKKLL